MAKKSKAGRKTSMTPEVVQKLEDALKHDFTVERACRYAGISKVTYYDWCNKDPNFLTKMEAAKDWLVNFAARRLVQGLDKGTISPVEVLKRRDRSRWGDGQDITTGGNPLTLGLGPSPFINPKKVPEKK